jgi:membrane protease YdiL (CAAX protease family)
VIPAVATAAALVAWNTVVADRRWHRRHYVRANLAATLALLAVARLRGCRRDELGLSPARARAGLVAGAALGATAAAALAAAAALPATRPLLRDARARGRSARAVAEHALVRVPLGTAVWEEVAFRAVLPALLERAGTGTGRDRASSRGTVTAAGALAFGLWHVRPTADAVRLNAPAAGRGRTTAAVVGGVAVTAGAHVVLEGLRRRTGSLLAPLVLHAAVNAASTVAAAVADRPAASSPPAGTGRRASRAGRPPGR